MPYNTPEEYFDVSESEIDNLIARVAPDAKNEEPETLELFRAEIRRLVRKSKDPACRVAESIADKYGHNKKTGNVLFDDSEDGKLDRSIYIMRYCFETAKHTIEIIARDQKLSSIDVKRYTSDTGKSEIFHPGQMAAHCLETIEEFYKEIGAVDPTTRVNCSAVEKYGVNDKGIINFSDTKDGSYDRDVCIIAYALNAARTTLKTIAKTIAQLSSKEVKRYTSEGVLIQTPSELAIDCISSMKRILNSSSVHSM